MKFTVQGRSFTLGRYAGVVTGEAVSDEISRNNSQR